MSILKKFIQVVLSLTLILRIIPMIETSPISGTSARAGLQDCIRECQVCKNSFKGFFSGHLCRATCESEPRLRVQCTLFLDLSWFVICMSSGDLLNWRNIEFWSTNFCYCLLSGPQNQFKTDKKRVWLVNVFCWTNKRFTFSVKKKKEKKYSYFKIRNLVKLANHRMTIDLVMK